MKTGIVVLFEKKSPALPSKAQQILFCFLTESTLSTIAVFVGCYITFKVEPDLMLFIGLFLFTSQKPNVQF